MKEALVVLFIFLGLYFITIPAFSEHFKESVFFEQKNILKSINQMNNAIYPKMLDNKK